MAHTVEEKMNESTCRRVTAAQWPVSSLRPPRGTFWVPGRLSDTLLARILNLSTHASKSSFTPTTQGTERGRRVKRGKGRQLTYGQKQLCMMHGEDVPYLQVSTRGLQY